MERSQVASFTIPLVFSYQSVFIKNPSNVYNYTAYLEPLTIWSWIVILIFLCVAPIALYGISKMSEQEEFSILTSFEAVYVALILLGSPKDPNPIPTRLVFLSILLASALLFWHWEAMLVSYLATRKTVLPFQTLEEMYLNTDFRLALIPSTVFEDAFKYSTDPIWSAIYEQRLKDHLPEYKDFPDHLFDMIHFIENDFSTALYDSYIPISSTSEFANCQIVATKGQYFHQPYAWPFPLNSPFLDIFNFYIKELIEKGQWDAIQSKYQASPQVCPDMSGEPIEFANCFTAFVILGFGFAFGLVLLLLEKLVHFQFPQQFFSSQALQKANLEQVVYQQKERIKDLTLELSFYRHLYKRSNNIK